jgi:beta-glucosidase
MTKGNAFHLLCATAAVAGLLACKSSHDKPIPPTDDCRAIPTLPSAYADWPALDKAITSDAEIEAQVQQVLAGMTLEEKVGQMVQGELQSTSPQDVHDYHLGSVLNGGGSWPGGNRHAAAADWLALADAYWDHAPVTSGGVTVPVIWGIDAVHGNNNVYGATIFPHNIGLGAAHDACLVQDIGAATAAQVRATGQEWAFGPTLAVVRDDRWGRTYEGYSEDPAIVRWYAAAAFKGLGDLSGGKRLNGVLGTAKHYIGDGGTTGGKDQGDNQHPESDLINIFGQGYYGALGSGGGQTVMISFNSWDSGTGDHPAEGKVHGSEYLITEVLKTKLGFDGLTVTDWDGHGQVSGCTTADCPRAINAGIDLFMFSNQAWKQFITNTVAEVALPDTDPKHVPLARIDDAVTRILRVKARLGLLSPAAVKPSLRPGAALLHRDLARQAVRESLVLLKNNGQVLPLARPTAKKLLVVGNSMDSMANQVGGWTISWQGADVTNDDFPAGTADTILAGIRATVGADKVDAYATAAELAAAAPDYSQYAAVIAVIGETPYAEGSGDIGATMTLGRNVKYPAAAAQAVLSAVGGHGVPVVTVFLSGRPLWVNKELNLSDAFVAAFLPGSEGAGVADVLFRKADGTVDHEFTGKLSYSWPKSDCQTPLNVGDASYDPLFAYGYGLTSASTATVAALDETASELGCGQTQVVSTKLDVLTNTGVQEPYAMFLGSSTNWSQQVEVPGTVLGGTATDGIVSVTGSSNLTIDLQGDGRRVAFAGGGFAQLYFQTGAGTDLSAFLANDGALVFRGVLNAKAEGAKLAAHVACTYPCGGTVDVTALLGAAGEKTTFKVPLSCFKDDGLGDALDFKAINVPFQLQSSEAVDLTFASVSWVQGAANDPDAAVCATQGVATPAPAGGSALTFLSTDDALLGTYVLYLGSQANWSMAVEPAGGTPGGAMLDGTSTTADGYLSVTSTSATTVGTTTFAKDTTWSGAGMAQVYLQAPDRDPAADGNQGWDLSGYVGGGGMLAFDAVVKSLPPAEGVVHTRIDCGYPCMGELDASALFRDATLADGQPHTFKIPLACFQSAGTDFTKINTPFLIATDQAFEVSFANIRWLPGPATADAASCRSGGVFTSILSPPTP